MCRVTRALGVQDTCDAKLTYLVTAIKDVLSETPQGLTNQQVHQDKSEMDEVYFEGRDHKVDVSLPSLLTSYALHKICKTDGNL